MTAQFQNLQFLFHRYSNLRDMVIKQQQLLGKTFDFMSYNSNSNLQIISLLETFNLFQSLLHDIPHLIDGKLTPNIIAPDTITDILKSVSQQLQRSNPYLYVHCDISHFYTFERTTITTLKDDVLYIKIKIPIGTNYQSYSLYRVDIFPVPANVQQEMYTILTDVQPFLLISENNSTFLELS